MGFCHSGGSLARRNDRVLKLRRGGPRPVTRSRRKVVANLFGPMWLAMDQEITKQTSRSVAQVFVAISVGVLASKFGILNRESNKSLSSVIYFVLLPCLSLTTLIRSLQTHASLGLAALPIFAVGQITLGLALGFVLVRLLRLESEADRRITIVSCAFNNSGTIPLFLAGTLFGSSAELTAEFVASTSLYLIGWSALFWTVAYSILSEWSPTSGQNASSPTMGARMRLLRNRLLSPPILSSTAGVALGFFGPAGRMIMNQESVVNVIYKGLYGLGIACAPCSILVLAGSLLDFPAEQRKLERTGSDGDKPPKRDVQPTRSEGELAKLAVLVVAIGLARFVLFPGITSFLLRSPRTSFLFPENPMLRFTLLVQSVMPPAQNIALVLQLENKNAAASQAAKILLVLYIISFFPASLVTSLGMSWYFGKG